MFTSDELSSAPVPAAYVGAGTNPSLFRLMDIEDGPVSLQDPSQGLMYQQWSLYAKDLAIWLSAPNTEPYVILDNPDNVITDISLCFNQNADLHYAWVDKQKDKAYWRFYDTTIAGYTIMELPAGTRTPKCTLDDKRPAQSGGSDIILTYLDSAGALKFRKQRDRYAIEYLLDAGPYVSIERFYMNAGWRLQWTLVKR